MSSVSSTNSVLTNLLQTLSNAGSPVASSPAVLAALQKASPGDLVQLSAAATQLESVDAIFGISDGSTTNSNTPFGNLESLLNTTYGGTSNTGSNQDSLLSASDTPGLFAAEEENSSPNLLNTIG